MGLLASIPAPPGPLILELGSFKLRWYGTLIAIGILVAFQLGRRELGRRGIDPEKAYTLAAWCVPGGVIGARLYHIATDWERFSGHPERLLQVWNGGLGMPGVILGGAIGAAIGARRAGIAPLVAFDSVAPGLILAQAIGRFGNYFNQELFGGPTDLPWGLEVDPAFRPDAYATATTFHPTFLYESLWDLAICAALLLLARALWQRLPAGSLFALYLALYGAGRVVLEGIRIDPAAMIGGLRFNQLLFGVVAVLGAAWFLRGLAVARRTPPPAPPAPPKPVDAVPGARGRRARS